MISPVARTHLSSLCLLIILSFMLLSPALLTAAPDTATASIPAGKLKYKVISGYKQEFNDDLQQEFSKGWQPVGGVSVTTWNNNLYFAQLIAKPSN